jgi:hypothetical protein
MEIVRSYGSFASQLSTETEFSAGSARQCAVQDARMARFDRPYRSASQRLAATEQRTIVRKVPGWAILLRRFSSGRAKRAPDAEAESEAPRVQRSLATACGTQDAGRRIPCAAAQGANRAIAR